MLASIAKYFFHFLAGSRSVQRAASRIGMRKPSSFARRFIAGETIDEAIAAARMLHARGLLITLDHLGENVTTPGLRLRAMPTGTRLHLDLTAVVEVTGLRNPCVQIDGFQKGLMAATLDKDDDGHLIREAGIMGIVLADGGVRPGDAIAAVMPDGPHRPLAPV